jgi:hypothetical protein
VPKRTNLFQDVVGIIYEHLAGDAVKEESAMLVNSRTGEEREVDVVLRSTIAGHETVIAIEAAGRTRKAAADWVEQMIGKHKNLPTDKVVLVAEAGFTEQARTLAEAENMVALTPEDVRGDDPAAEIVRAIPALWPKTVQLKLEPPAMVYVTRPDDSRVRFKAPDQMDLMLDDGKTVWSLERYVLDDIDASLDDLAETLDLVNVGEDTERTLDVEFHPPFVLDGHETGLSARFESEGRSELYAIDKIVLSATAKITVSEIKLTHKRLAALDVTYAYGEGTFQGLPALAVVSDGPHGRKITIRVREDEPQTS